MFEKYLIKYKKNLFDELSKITEYEKVTKKGRHGAVLVDSRNDVVPIVRTTTIYNKPAQKFSQIHYDIMNDIKKISKNDNVGFNNALIEIYDTNYCTMGLHSDQSLDLADDSYICVFSCYDDPSTKDIRKLVINKKGTDTFSEIYMEHNFVIIWPLATNSEYLHKIILDTKFSNDQWLGITFRLSKTFIKFINNEPYFYPPKKNNEDNNDELKKIRLADDNERKYFFKCRGFENKNVSYKYDDIDFTISPSDLMAC